MPLLVGKRACKCFLKEVTGTYANSTASYISKSSHPYQMKKIAIKLSRHTVYLTFPIRSLHIFIVFLCLYFSSSSQQ